MTQPASDDEPGPAARALYGLLARNRALQQQVADLERIALDRADTLAGHALLAKSLLAHAGDLQRRLDRARREVARLRDARPDAHELLRLREENDRLQALVARLQMEKAA